MTRIIQWNIRGFYANLNYLKDLLGEHQPLIVALQETNFTPKDSPRLRGYSILRKDRTDAARASGGSALLISNSIPMAPVPLATPLEAVAACVSVGRAFTVCSIYLPEGIDNQIDIDNLINQLPSPFVLLGDFNGHSPLWGCADSNARGRRVEDLLTRHSLTLANTGSVTYFHAPTRTFTAIDLTICSPVLLPLLTWRAGADLMGSDHFPLTITYQTRRRCRATRPPRWKLEKADWNAFQEEADLSSIPISNLTVEEAVTVVTDRLIKAAEAFIPKTSKKLPSHPKPWWNAECDGAQKLVKRWWGIFRRYPTTSNLINFKRARARARFIRKQSQRDSWRKYASSINTSSSSKQVWEKVRKFSGSYTTQTTSMLKVNGVIHSELPEIANTLGETFAFHSSEAFYSPQFQRVKDRAEKIRLDFREKKSEEFNCPFTLTELKVALHRSRDCAVGPDRIHYAFFRHLADNALDKLLELFNKIWSNQDYPDSWRKAIVIAILKPGKDPTDPNSYRPIALTSCLGKVLERMVNARLVWFLESNDLLSNKQCGFRRQRSTMDNLINLETSIRDAFLRGEHLVSIFFDLEKAYDTTWKYGILRDLHGFGLRGNLPIFISNFLADRTFQVRVGSTLSRTYPQEQGVPQGCVLSVTLFSVKINNITSSVPVTVENGLFVDDFHASSHSRNMRTIERQLQRALYGLDDWATNNGFKFSTAKTVVVHFCRRRGLHPEPSLFLGGVELPVVSETKYLGLNFDRKLTFAPHIKALRVKCLKTLNLLKVISSTSWGADRATLLHLYKALVRSKLDYGSPVYASARDSTLRMLDPVHHQALRTCTGAFRTSPIQSLYAEASEPPLEVRRSQLSLQYSAKLKPLQGHPTWSSVFEPKWEQLYINRPSAILPFGHRISCLLGQLGVEIDLQPLSLKELPPWNTIIPECDLSLHQLSKATTANNEYLELFSQHRSLLSSHIALYTDGSKTDVCVASAFICCNAAVSRRLPMVASVYTAELFAIDMALNHIYTHSHTDSLIYSDSLSAVLALQSLSPHNHPVLISIRRRLYQLSSRNVRIQFCWIPGHVGISGNEKADLAARSASSVGVPLISSVVPFTDYRAVFRVGLRRWWERTWSNQHENKLLEIKPNIKPWKNCSRKDRREEVLLSRLRIGHTSVTHSHLLKREDPPFCVTDGVPFTVKHFLLACSDFRQHRSIFFRNYTQDTLTLKDILGENVIDFNPLFGFLRATGFYLKF